MDLELWWLLTMSFKFNRKYLESSIKRLKNKAKYALKSVTRSQTRILNIILASVVL